MIVRTVLGDIAPETLGPTLAHEHFIIDSPLVEDRWPHIHLRSVDDAVQELAECVAAGLGAAVDAMPAASGRDPVRLAEISRRSGVHLLAVTGLHTAKYYEGQRWTSEEAPDVLADLFVADIDEGIDRHDYMGPVVRRTPHRAGVIKVAWLGEEPSPRDRRLFEGAAIAHRRTGAPILTHCEGGRGGHAQLDLLEHFGVEPARVVLSHTDKVADRTYHESLLERGAWLEFDQALRRAYEDGGATTDLLVHLLEHGRGDRVMVATDGARKGLWARHGGPGLAWIMTHLPRVLRERGLSTADVDALLVDNPARFFAFEPR